MSSCLGTRDVAGEQLDQVHSRFERRDRLGRTENARHDRDRVSVAKFDRIEIERGREHELRPGEDRRAGGLGIEHAARPYDDVVAVSGAKLRDQPVRPGHGERDLDQLDAAAHACVDGGKRLFEPVASDNGDDSALSDLLQNLLSVHIHPHLSGTIAPRCLALDVGRACARNSGTFLL